MSFAVAGGMCQDIQNTDRQRAYAKEQSGKVNTSMYCTSSAALSGSLNDCMVLYVIRICNFVSLGSSAQ